MRSRWCVLVAALVAATSFPGLASADGGLEGDPDDTAGRLDVRQIRHGHGTRMSLLRHRIRMGQDWGDRVLRRKSGNKLYLLFDTRGGDCVDRRVRIRRSSGELRASIQVYDPTGCTRYDDVGGQSNFVRLRAEIERRRGRDIIVTFAKRRLRRHLEEYSWAVATSFKGGKCERRCDDFAPDESEGVRGALVHDLS